MVRCVLRSAADAQVRHEHEPVGRVQRRERPIVQLMLAVEHGEQKVAGADAG